MSEKYYGLSKKSWAMIVGLLIVYFIFIHDDGKYYNVIEKETTKLIAPSSQNITETQTNGSVKENFTESNKLKVYNFNTKWCGYSVRFQPQWNEFMTKINDNNEVDNVQAYDIKCDDPEFEGMCEEYKVEGFPTVIFEKGNNRKIYQGQRTSDALMDAIKKFN